MRRILLILLALIWTAGQLPAQIRITGLEQLASRAKESVEITLDASMMQLAAGFMSGKNSDEAKTRELLNSLRSITVRSFEFDQPGQYRQQDLEPIRTQLRAPGWSRILNVVDDDETVEIYTRMEGDRVAGFAILAAEARELAVIAIEGNISLQDLADLGGQMGIPRLPMLKQTPKGKGNK